MPRGHHPEWDDQAKSQALCDAAGIEPKQASTILERHPTAHAVISLLIACSGMDYRAISQAMKRDKSWLRTTMKYVNEVPLNPEHIRSLGSIIGPSIKAAQEAGFVSKEFDLNTSNISQAMSATFLAAAGLPEKRANGSFHQVFNDLLSRNNLMAYQLAQMAEPSTRMSASRIKTLIQQLANGLYDKPEFCGGNLDPEITEILQIAGEALRLHRLPQKTPTAKASTGQAVPASGIAASPLRE